jgi:hypothetical protein
VLAGFGVTGRKLERVPRTGAAIEMHAAVAGLRVEVDNELCERAIVQMLTVAREDGVRLQLAVILLAEEIHRFLSPTAATARSPTGISAPCHASRLCVKPIVFVSVLSDSYNSGYELPRAVLYAAALGWMSLWYRSIFINIGTANNTVGLIGPDRKAHDDLKSVCRRKLPCESEDKKLSRVYGQGSTAEMQIEMDRRGGQCAADK